MRVSDLGQLFLIRDSLESLRSSQSRLQRQLSTGKRLIADSDNPVDAEEIQSLRRQIGYLELYKKNATRAGGLLMFADASLDSGNDILLEAIQLGTQGATDLASSSDRKNMADRLRAIKTELISLANTRYQGQYVFGGSQNLQQPFTVDSGDGSVSFSGNSSGRRVPISESVEVQATLSGQAIFLTATDIFAALDNLAEAIEQGDLSAAANQLQQVEKGRDAVSDARSTIGRQIQSIDQVQQQLDRSQIELVKRLSQLEDVDIAQIVSQLTIYETAIAAASYTEATIGRRSLFDYLA